LQFASPVTTRGRCGFIDMSIFNPSYYHTVGMVIIVVVVVVAYIVKKKML